MCLGNLNLNFLNATLTHETKHAVFQTMIKIPPGVYIEKEIWMSNKAFDALLCNTEQVLTFVQCM
jgi:hypothetical protein